MAPELLHGLLPSGCAYDIARPPFHVQGQLGVSHHTKKRIMVSPTRLVRFVTHFEKIKRSLISSVYAKNKSGFSLAADFYFV